MLLSEAKEQAQILLNEAFYAYHASPAPHDELIAHRAGYGPGIYLLSSASPNYKGTPNGRSWIVTNKGVGMNFGRYIHKCVIPGSLDTTVLFVSDFTFNRISKGKIKSINDIDDFLEHYSAREKTKNNFLKWKNGELEALSSLKNFLSSKIKNFLSGVNNVDEYVILKLCGLIEDIEDDHFIRYEVLSHSVSRYYEWAEDKLPRQCTLLKLLSELKYANYADKDADAEKYWLPRLKKLIPKYFKINLQDYPYDVEELCSLATKLANARLIEICKDIYKYFACMEVYIKKFYCVHNCNFFIELFGGVDYLYDNKDFFRALGIVGFYFDKYAEDDVRSEEIVIWDPADVTVTSIKDVGVLDKNKFDDYANITPEREKPTYTFRPKWDKDGYPLDKYINYDNSELPEQNKELPTGKEMQSAIEDRYKQNQFKNGTWRSAENYTTKNPHYRTGSWSFKQSNKNTGNLK